MAGLLDRDEDLAAWLARQYMPPDPINAGFTHSFSPSVQARINAEVQPAFLDQSAVVTPTAGLTLGPLSLSGGLNLQQALNPETGSPYLKATPTMGAGLKVPMLGGTGELAASYTPEQMKSIEAAYRRKLLGGDLDVTLRHQQPYGGRPDTYVGARYSRSF